MPLTSPVVFPLFPINDGKCGCGNANCGRIGKHPAVAWGDLKFGDAVPLPRPGAGFGLKTGALPKGSGIFVVDLDSAEAVDAFSALGECPETLTVQTPRGLHLYFEHPGGFHVGNSAGSLTKGVDVRGDGGFVVGPGSPHRSGGRYELAVDVAPAPAPAWLLEWLRARPAPAPTQAYEGDVSDEVEKEYRRTVYTRYLRDEARPCVQGQGGDAVLFEVVQRGAYDLRLPVDDVLELVREHYDPRCSPPWGDELEDRVRHKARDAKTKSTRMRIEPPPRDMAGMFAAPTPEQKLEALDSALPAAVPKKNVGIFWDDWDAPLEPPQWLVDGLIPVSTVGGFVAHGSSLKTWTALSLASAVAQGVPWLDKYTTRKGRVIVLDYESGEYELRRRVRLLEGGRVVGLGAWTMPSKTIDDIELWIELGKIPDVSLVIIDSLAAGTSPGVDENTKDAAWPLQLAARYSDSTGASVLFIHHSKKDDGGDARKAVRGSTAIFAAMDWCYGFAPGDDTPKAKRMQLECIKPCMGARPLPVPLELTDEGLHLFDSEPKLERNAPDHEVQARICLALQGGPIETKALIARAISMRAQAVAPQVEALEVRRDIVKVRGVGYMLDNDETRRERVKVLVCGSSTWRTEAQIARAAQVDTQFVLDLVRDGVVVRSADGRFIVTQSANSINAESLES